MPEADWTFLARLVRPQGRHGEILSDILTDFPERFAERKRLFLIAQGAGTPAREVTLEKHWLHKLMQIRKQHWPKHSRQNMIR